MNLAVFIDSKILFSLIDEGNTSLKSPGFESIVSLINNLKGLGFLIIVISHYKYRVSSLEMQIRHNNEVKLLKNVFNVDFILTCPHDNDDDCYCRKPRPGLVYEAAHRWDIDLSHSFVIGDSWEDAKLAESAGCFSVLIQSSRIVRCHRDILVTDLESAFSMVMKVSGLFMKTKVKPQLPLSSQKLEC